jgi:hypothetical protein
VEALFWNRKADVASLARHYDEYLTPAHKRRMKVQRKEEEERRRRKQEDDGSDEVGAARSGGGDDGLAGETEFGETEYGETSTENTKQDSRAADDESKAKKKKKKEKKKKKKKEKEQEAADDDAEEGKENGRVSPGKTASSLGAKKWTPAEDYCLKVKYSSGACPATIALDGLFKSRGRTEEQVQARLANLGLWDAGFDAPANDGTPADAMEDDDPGELESWKTFLRNKLKACKVYRAGGSSWPFAVVPATSAEFDLLRSGQAKAFMKTLRFSAPNATHGERFWRIPGSVDVVKCLEAME